MNDSHREGFSLFDYGSVCLCHFIMRSNYQVYIHVNNKYKLTA